MPADDRYDIAHEKNAIKADDKYGCWNHKPFSSGYYAPVRVYGFDGLFTIEPRWVPFRNSQECRYDMARTDLRCNGCPRVGEWERV